MNNLTHKNNYLFLAGLTVFFFTGKLSFAQDIEFKRTSIRTGIGIGIVGGEGEDGFGFISSIGWQKSYGKKNKLRLNPNVVTGNFVELFSADPPKQFYRLTSLGLNFHYDLIKYRAFSIVTTGGVVISYSRGLIGAGTQRGAGNSISFHSLYYGLNLSGGIRIDPENSKLAYELRVVNIEFGDKFGDKFGSYSDYILSYLMFGIDFKLQK